MATTANSRTNSDAASVPFSYAQAAKGLVAAPGSSVSKASSSGAVTPAKDSQSVSTSAAAVMSWAEDAEGSEARPENNSGPSETPAQNTKPAAAPSELTAAALASPEIGASTASTVTKDDDVSSIPNTSSDSTWENKSQASTSVDKSTEPSEKSSQKGKGKKREQAPAKPLQEAPLPTVNIWQQRAELRKPAKPTMAAASSNGAVNGASLNKQPKDVENRVAPNEVKTRGFEEERANSVRPETKPEADSDKARKNTRARPQERDARETPGVVSLPPERDQESWPTMDAATAIDEDRKKTLEKTEKSDKERKESTGAKTKGQWVKVPFVPSVNFNTPLPSNGARRGGRGPARGGAQNGGRAGLSTSGPEKDASSPAATANGDQSRRGRPDVPVRESSPKAKRTASASSLAVKDKASQLNGERSKSTLSEIDSPSKENGVSPESQNNISGPNGHTTFPRQYPSNRPSKGKRTEWSGPDRRREGDSGALPKENGVPNDRTSASTQTDGPEDAERRTFPEGQAPYQSKRGAGDRYGSYNSRERRGGRGGGRGGNFSNGHQFANGHMKSSSTYPGPMSPTTFNPEQSPYFPQSRYRNGPRSQSVTNENMYRMPGQFGGPPQMPPINTYMGGNGFDYPMMQPMSAAPFGQFGMDHFAMFSMVTTQLEYYFSLENLCKDMYLRKHMDSKGFVFLSFISEFNRIKHLTTDLELIKLVCYQSRAIEFRVGHDGKDRLRARENWQQWVLPVEERDSSAQNEGPEELYNPPIPHPNGFDPNGNPRFPDMSTPSPSAPGAYGTEGPHPMANGFHPGAPQHVSATASENAPNGLNAEHVNGNAISNGHLVDDSTKAVSGEPDSFSNEQVKSLTVIVRKQDHLQMPALPPPSNCSFSNTLHSRNDTGVESEERVGRRAIRTPNGVDSSSSVDSEVQDQFPRTASPFASASSISCFQYWVKDNDAPVDVAPPGCCHESYSVLRSKALYQRQSSASGGCSYDMSVLYQFWSHFLIRNFNADMYHEFAKFALEDSHNKLSDVGVSNLIKFYGESLLSSQNVVRGVVAHDFIDLIQSGIEPSRPAFQQLRSALHNDYMNARNRIRINDLLDDELKASLR